MPKFVVDAGSMQEAALNDWGKVVLIGGGYGNGKTATGVAKALRVAKDYPGCNILIARSTYPKLNDTIRKEFIKWCPKSWIKSFPLSQNSTNTCVMHNATHINFRYIAQQGKKSDDGETTSNLLSATYDFILVDQLEDPEISEKDFEDLLGRLRGNTPYMGDDPTMPKNGPRQFMGLLNPTRNWAYRKLVKPLQTYKDKGTVTDELLCVRYPETSKPILIDGKPQLLISLHEGSTYTNKHNLGEDFIQTLESAYTGSRKSRFLYGEWAAYEGLVYPEFNSDLSGIDEGTLHGYIEALVNAGYTIEWSESYDFGIQVPSCYLLWITDPWGNTIAVDGFYKPEFSIDKQCQEIKTIRRKWGAYVRKPIAADPDIFRRKAGDRRIPGKSVVMVFGEVEGGLIQFARANNNLEAGIIKVQQYLDPRPIHRHPVTAVRGAPYFYYNLSLDFIEDEMGSFYWGKTAGGEPTDKPQEHDDHCMDAIRYHIVGLADIAKLQVQRLTPASRTMWREIETSQELNGYRYGRH